MLRQDNADMRPLDDRSRNSVLPEACYVSFLAKQEAIRKEFHGWRELLCSTTLGASCVGRDEYKDLPSREDSLTNEVIQQIEIELKYAGYIERQEAEVEKFREMRTSKSPIGLITTKC